MTVEKVDRYFLNLPVRVKIIRNGTNQHWVPPDGRNRKNSQLLL